MTFIRWIQRGCRFQLYKDFYGRKKIKPIGVCAEPQWKTFGSLWKCIKEYFKESEYKMDKQNIFYYAKLNGVPVYFQPEENEVVGRNWFCKLLLAIQEFLGYPEFRIEIEHRTITREEIE